MVPEEDHERRSPSSVDEVHEGPPLLSVVVPAYDESSLLTEHLGELAEYLRRHEAEYRWELVVVNDGSSDDTGALAESFAREVPNVRVVHHVVNRGVGEAIQTGVAASQGDYVVTLDADLSYSPEHIGAMLSRLREVDADMVLASPYMKGGRTSKVPWSRRMLSRWGNRFLAVFARANLTTLTSMVRAYRGPFIRSLDLRGQDLAVLPEAVYKTMVVRGRIEEVPAHLDWSKQAERGGRASSTRILAHIMGTTLSGFLLRPFVFFIVPGLLLLAFSAYVNMWMIIHWLDALQRVEATGIRAMTSQAVALSFSEYPHTFVIGLLGAGLAIQLISLGILSLQSKRYFEELFHLGTRVGRSIKEDGGA